MSSAGQGKRDMVQPARSLGMIPVPGGVGHVFDDNGFMVVKEEGGKELLRFPVAVEGECDRTYELIDGGVKFFDPEGDYLFSMSARAFMEFTATIRGEPPHFMMDLQGIVQECNRLSLASREMNVSEEVRLEVDSLSVVPSCDWVLSWYPDELE